MTVNQCIRIDAELWEEMKAKAKDHMFESPTAYLRHIIKEDLKKGSLEKVEERLVATMGTLSRDMRTIGNAQQALMEIVWQLLEISAGQGTAAGDLRMKQLQVLIASRVKGQDTYKELTNGHQETPA